MGRRRPAGRTIKRFAVAHEAGRDGFWLQPQLPAGGTKQRINPLGVPHGTARVVVAPLEDHIATGIEDFAPPLGAPAQRSRFARRVADDDLLGKAGHWQGGRKQSTVWEIANNNPFASKHAGQRDPAVHSAVASALVNRPTQLRDKLVERRTLRRVELAMAMSGLAVTGCPASAALPDRRSSALACVACLIAKTPSTLRGEWGRDLRRWSKGDRRAWGRAKHRGNLRGRLGARRNRRRALR